MTICSVSKRPLYLRFVCLLLFCLATGAAQQDPSLHTSVSSLSSILTSSSGSSCTSRSGGEASSQQCSVKQQQQDSETTAKRNNNNNNNPTAAQLAQPAFRYPTGNESIVQYLNPALVQNRATLARIHHQLRDGKAVVIRNAFQAEYAEAMHAELIASLDDFRLHVDGYNGTFNETDDEEEEDDDIDYEKSTFACHHHNIYNFNTYTTLMNATVQLLNSASTKAFMTALSGRDCYGTTTPSASYYKPGDYSLPHTDYHHDRAVAYVWHLTKNWKTGYGGHLYWCKENAHNAFLDASFNTLVLFSVTPLSHHMVTTVAPGVTEHRLTINGWFNNDWDLSFEPDDDEDDEHEDDDDEFPYFEDYFTTTERMLQLTEYQYLQLQQLAKDCKEEMEPDFVSEERCEKIVALADTVYDMFHPEYDDLDVIDL